MCIDSRCCRCLRKLQPCEEEWRRIFKGCLFFSSAFEDAKAAVAIIVHPRIQPLEISCRVVCKGFLIAVELISSNQNKHCRDIGPGNRGPCPIPS